MLSPKLSVFVWRLSVSQSRLFSSLSMVVLKARRSLVRFASPRFITSALISSFKCRNYPSLPIPWFLDIHLNFLDYSSFISSTLYYISIFILYFLIIIPCFSRTLVLLFLLVHPPTFVRFLDSLLISLSTLKHTTAIYS